MQQNGYIILQRSFLGFRWFKSPTVCHLFQYFLLRANFQDCQFNDKVIKRGQLVTCHSIIAAETGLTLQQTRTAIKKLSSTGDIRVSSSNRYSVVTVCKYDSWLEVQQSNNNPITNEQQLYNNNNKVNKVNKEEANASSTRTRARETREKRFVKPTIEELRAYISEKGYTFSAEKFIAHYDSNGWMVGRTPMKDWKAACRNWQIRRSEEKPQSKESALNKESDEKYNKFLSFCQTKTPNIYKQIKSLGTHAYYEFTRLSGGDGYRTATILEELNNENYTGDLIKEFNKRIKNG